MLRLVTVLAFLFASLAFAELADSPGANCADVPAVAAKYLSIHLVYRELTPELRQRTSQTYLELLKDVADPDDVALTKLDAEFLKKVTGFYADKLADHLAAPDREPAPSCFFIFDLVRDTLRKNLTSNLDELSHWDTPATDAASLHRREVADARVAALVKQGLSVEAARAEVRVRAGMQLINLIRLSDKFLTALFLDAFAESLDPHSNYLWLAVDAEAGLALWGAGVSKGGIGVNLDYTGLYPTIDSVLPDRPAARSGRFKVGDRLIAFSQEGHGEQSLAGVQEWNSPITGKAGTTLQLRVQRLGPTIETFTVELTREELKAGPTDKPGVSLETREVRGQKLARIGLRDFYGLGGGARSSDDFGTKLKEAIAAGTEGVLIDLSGNPGGSASEATRILGYFLKEGKVAGFERRDGTFEYESVDGKDFLFGGPIAVKVDSHSASASEYFAGAIKDYGRGLIVGDAHTFGKGTSFSPGVLPSHMAMFNVTTSLYFNPGGGTPQRDGIVPQIILKKEIVEDGEKSRPYALAPKNIPAFLADDAHSGAGTAWKKITPQAIERAGKTASDDFAWFAEYVDEMKK